MIKGFAHVCLAAKDLAAAERFYCRALGFKKVFDFIREGQVAGFYLEVAPGSYIEIFRQEEIEAGAKGPIRHFCLEADDLDRIGARLAEHGYEASKKTLGADRSWQMWTTDPSGVAIEFHEYTPQSCQVTRRNCIIEPDGW